MSAKTDIFDVNRLFFESFGQNIQELTIPKESYDRLVSSLDLQVRDRASWCEFVRLYGVIVKRGL